MNWYYVVQGQQAGPVSDEQLDGMLRTGKILPDTLVWREGMPTWAPCSQVKPGVKNVASSASSETAAEAVCSECGRMFPMAETIRHGDSNICASCKPVFLQRLREGARVGPAGMHYAGFWIRFAAKLLDGLILGAIIIVPALILIAIFAVGAARHSSTLHLGADVAPHASDDAVGFLGNIIGILIQFVAAIFQIFYSAFFLGKYGATPGKMVCGLIVVDANGNRIGYGRAFGRAFAELLSGMICDIGYIIAGFDNPQKRALHDHICNTRVVYKNG